MPLIPDETFWRGAASQPSLDGASNGRQATVIGVVTTHNPAIGVGVGVLVAMVLFARRVAHFVTVERTMAEVDGAQLATYRVNGEPFFAASNELYTRFEYRRAERRERPDARSPRRQARFLAL